MSAETKDLLRHVPSGFHNVVQENLEWRFTLRHNSFKVLPSVVQ
jgi:hypothetical protein